MFELCGLNLDFGFQIICGVQFVVHETYAIEILLVNCGGEMKIIEW